MKLPANLTLVMPGTSRVHETALAELRIALQSVGLDGLPLARTLTPGHPSILLGTPAEVEIHPDWIRAGKTELHHASPDRDCFELFWWQDTCCLLGGSPRGMLQAVYEFHDLLIEHGEIPADLQLRKSFQMPFRIFHQRFDRWPGQRADLRYISRLGASHCLLEHDWTGDLRHFQGYVTSPRFPLAVDRETVARNNRQLHALLKECGDYGLDAAFWMTELPCQGGPWLPQEARDKFLDRFPPELLSDSGTYQGKVLCFSHPQVQDFYRDLIQRFLGEFPEISVLFLFGLDADGEFCDPATCPRCGGMSKFAQRDRLLRFLIDEGQRVRPGLRVLTTGWGWERAGVEEFLARQKQLPAASGLFMAAECDGWQAERQDHHLLRATREICRETGQLFIGYDNFHWGDDTVHQLRDIQDFPLGIGAKLKRWQRLAVDGVFDHWGGFNEDLSSNSVACREFFLNPAADVPTTCRKIARRQFGAAAGEAVFAAWSELENAHAALSNHCHWAPQQWPAWYPGFGDAPVPVKFEQERPNLLKDRQPEKFHGTFNYNPADFATLLQGVSDAWTAAWPHYEKAIAFMTEAERLAGDEPVGYAFWWNGPEQSPSRREHLRRQLVYLRAMALFGREIGLHFGLHALYEQTGCRAEAYFAQAKTLLAADEAACRAAGDYFGRLEAEGTLVRPGCAWSRQFLSKAEKIDGVLHGGGEAPKPTSA